LSLEPQLSHAGVTAEDAKAILPAFDRVGFVIEQSVALSTRGRPSTESLQRATEFVERDPVFNSLYAYLGETDTVNGVRSDLASKFLEDAKIVIRRVNKVLDQDHPPLPDDMQSHIRRAFVALLYVNVINGSKNPATELFSVNPETAIEALLPELWSLVEDNQPKFQYEDQILKYLEQVTNLSFQNPLGAKGLTELWDTLRGDPSKTGSIDRTSEIQELCEPLSQIATTVKKLERFNGGESLSPKEIIQIAQDTGALIKLAGLGHFSPNTIFQHLEEEGILSTQKAELLKALFTLSERGITVPSTLVISTPSQHLLIEAANGKLTDPKSNVPEEVQIERHLDIQQRIFGDVAFVEVIQQINPLALSTALFCDEKERIFNFYQSCITAKIPASADDIIRLAIDLKVIGILGPRSNRIISEGTVPEYPKAAWNFLNNIVYLGRSGIHDAITLAQAFTQKLEERVGLFAEAEAAAHLLAAGHEIINLRKVGTKSGHIDYDIVARINGVLYGIEVKSTVLALQQKNASKDGSMNGSQLYRLSKNAPLDGLVPAVLCLSTKDINMMRNQLHEMWQKVGQLTGGVAPKFLKRDGTDFSF